MNYIKKLLIKFLLKRKAAIEETIPFATKPSDRGYKRNTIRMIDEWIEKLRK